MGFPAYLFKMKASKSLRVNSLGIFFVAITTAVSSVFAADLTPEQMVVVRKKLAELRDTVDGNAKTRNLGAGDAFMTASKDAKAALALYLDCYKVVKFDRENRKVGDFRLWEEKNENRLKDPAFLEALQIQLRYLAISCKAAEVKEFDQVFAPLMEFTDALSRLEESPDGMLMQSVSRTVFAERYYLEKLLGKNEGWEDVAYNIEGIYNKAILPYLRNEKPEALMSAWDRRIEQQKRLVSFLSEQNKKELRGMDREQEARMRDRQDERGGILKAHDPEKFARETLPQLKWSKLIDSYHHLDQVMGAKALLDFITVNITNPKSEEWLEQLEGTLGATEGALETADETAAESETTKKFDPNGFE